MYKDTTEDEMNENLRKSNQDRFATIIKNLEKRNMCGYACETKEEACELALKLMFDAAAKAGKAVPSAAAGGSMTLDEIGLSAKIDELHSAGKMKMLYRLPGYSHEAYISRIAGLSADTFFMSTNAITMEGELVNIDGTGNRVAALCFGPEQIVVIAGYNKIVLNEQAGYDRIATVAAPANCVRLGMNTPCSKTGRCGQCLSKEDTICGAKVTTRFSMTPGRVNVILVNEELGF